MMRLHLRQAERERGKKGGPRPSEGGLEWMDVDEAAWPRRYEDVPEFQVAIRAAATEEKKVSRGRSRGWASKREASHQFHGIKLPEEEGKPGKKARTPVSASRPPRPPPSAPSSRLVTQKRLASDLKSILRNGDELAQATANKLIVLVSPQDPLSIRVIVGCPDETPYEYGIFVVHLKLPLDYPFSPPDLRFETSIWHPNVDFETGVVGLSCLEREHWCVAWTLKDILRVLYSMLVTPFPDYYWTNDQAGKEYQKDPAKYTATARSLTSVTASPERFLNADSSTGDQEDWWIPALERFGGSGTVPNKLDVPPRVPRRSASSPIPQQQVRVCKNRQQDDLDDDENCRVPTRTDEHKKKKPNVGLLQTRNNNNNMDDGSSLSSNAMSVESAWSLVENLEGMQIHISQGGSSAAGSSSFPGSWVQII